MSKKIRTYCWSNSATIGFFSKIIGQFQVKMNYKDIVDEFNKQTKDFGPEVRVGLRIIIEGKNVKIHILSPFTIDLIKQKINTKTNNSVLSKEDILDIVKIKEKHMNTMEVDKNYNTV